MSLKSSSRGLAQLGSQSQNGTHIPPGGRPGDGEVPPSAQEEEAIREQARQALQGDMRGLHVPGFESSKVMALTSTYLFNPLPGGPTRRKLVRQIQAVGLFLIYPNGSPYAPGKRGKDTKALPSGIEKELGIWHVDLRRTGTIKRGYPPPSGIRRKPKVDVTIECADQDFVDMALGKTNGTKLYAAGRLKIKGDIDKAVKLSEIIKHERSRVYEQQQSSSSFSPSFSQKKGDEEEEQLYQGGAPAPLPDRARL